MEKLTAEEGIVSPKVTETRRHAAVAAETSASAAAAAARKTEGKHSLKARDAPTTQKEPPSQQKVAAKKVVPPKAIIGQQRAKGLDAVLKATPVQQPKPAISTGKRSPPLVKALHQAASAVKVATEAKKSETQGRKDASELDEAGTEQETKEEQKEGASEAVTASAR